MMYIIYHSLVLINNLLINQKTNQTNQNLVQEIETGNFREDFYFRLCADRIETPSLLSMVNADSSELDLLVGFIAEKIAGPDEKDQLCEEVTQWIRKSMPANYPWPGNFRELEQCVRNVLVHGEYHAQTGLATTSQHKKTITSLK